MHKEFTKAERHEIYKKALRLHRIDIKECVQFKSNLTGMCRLIRQAARVGTFAPIELLFPEFYNLKPKHGFLWWWARTYNNKTRIKKFKEIIELTK